MYLVYNYITMILINDGIDMINTNKEFLNVNNDKNNYYFLKL